jgi:hypothetical protein
LNMRAPESGDFCSICSCLSCANAMLPTHKNNPTKINFPM